MRCTKRHGELVVQRIVESPIVRKRHGEKPCFLLLNIEAPYAMVKAKSVLARRAEGSW